MNLNFRGTGVAVITAFRNGQIDFEAQANIVEHLISGGVDYIVALGSTGEAAMLDDSESKDFLDFLIEKVNKRVPLVAGNFTGNNTRDVAKKIASYNFNGIDALLISSPGYVKPSQEGIYQHYTELAANTDRPIIIYNVPGRTASNIQWQTTIKLAESNPQFFAIKEASADLEQAQMIMKYRPEGFLVSSGDDGNALAMIAQGGDGVISVIANAFPKQFSTMINHALDHQMPQAQKLNDAFPEILQSLFSEGNPVGIKAAMNILGLCQNELRLPLVKMSDSGMDLLRNRMNLIQ